MPRSVIKPTDIVRFDEKISPHELKALQEKMSESDTESDIDMHMGPEGQSNNTTLYVHNINAVPNSRY